MASEVIAVSCGVAACQETLRTAMAIGADRASSSRPTSSSALAVAKAPAGAVRQGEPGLVICGKQAIDDDANQTGQMLACPGPGRKAPLPPRSWSSGNSAQVTRRNRRWPQTLEISPGCREWPTSASTSRYATPANIMKAKKKPAGYGQARRPRRRRRPV